MDAHGQHWPSIGDLSTKYLMYIIELVNQRFINDSSLVRHPSIYSPTQPLDVGVHMCLKAPQWLAPIWSYDSGVTGAPGIAAPAALIRANGQPPATGVDWIYPCIYLPIQILKEKLSRLETSSKHFFWVLYTDCLWAWLPLGFCYQSHSKERWFNCRDYFRKYLMDT